MEERLGTIRVSPHVVAAIIALAAASVPGVAWLNAHTPGNRRLRSPEEFGRAVRIRMEDDGVHSSIYLTVERNANWMQVGKAVQRAAAEAIERMLGLDVHAVNIYIVDVAR
ncbi:MAG: Asp23/Gls24 family envelope stress response protein [Chloroflexia bacterium]